MKYWIYINEEKKGPYSIDQLKVMTIPPTTLVWRDGMDTWVNANEIPELSSLYLRPPKYEEEPLVEEEDASQMPINELNEGSNEVSEDEPQEVACEVVPPMFDQSNCNENSDCENCKYRIKEEQKECPPSYLVWAILSTFCCCQLFGIIAIIYAAKVQPKFNSGDYEGAAKYSERAALWIILSFVCGLALSPLQSLLTALM